jgi:hypothetical protein
VLEPLPGETPVSALAELYGAARHADSPSPPRLHPYQLSYADFASVLHSLRDLPLDAVPRSAGHWALLLEASIGSRAEAAALLTAPASPAPLAATVRAMLRGAPGRRRDRVATIALARRLWRDEATAENAADAVYALAHVGRFRALLLTLDRIGVRDPAIWARLVDAARRVDVGNGGASATRGCGSSRARSRWSSGPAWSAASTRPTATPPSRRWPTHVDRDGAVDEAVRGWLLDAFIPRLPPLVRPDRFSGPDGLRVACAAGHGRDAR